jgi:uncharacterized protein YdhG (YjbR/CyaY superfamily)
VEEASANVERYLGSLAPKARAAVEEIRRRILAAAPTAQQRLSYGILAFAVDDVTVVHVAGWKHHVSLYPVPDAGTEAGLALAPYRSGASTAKFPLDRPLPIDVVDLAISALLVRAASRA